MTLFSVEIVDSLDATRIVIDAIAKAGLPLAIELLFKAIKAVANKMVNQFLKNERQKSKNRKFAGTRHSKPKKKRR